MTMNGNPLVQNRHSRAQDHGWDLNRTISTGREADQPLIGCRPFEQNCITPSAQPTQTALLQAGPAASQPAELTDIFQEVAVPARSEFSKSPRDRLPSLIP